MTAPPTDSAILLLIAELQQTIIGLRSANAALAAEVERLTADRPAQ